MKLFTTALKLNSLFAGNIACQSFMLANDQVQGGFDAATIGTSFVSLIVSKIIEFVTNFIYLICTFVLNFIEVIQIALSKILGINTDIEDYVVIDSSNPLIKIITSEEVLTIFKAVLGIAIVLIIIFTIFCIIKSEYAFAVEKSKDNGVGRILGRSLRSFFTLGMFPLILLLGIVLTNAILAGFNDILRNGGSSSIAAQVFVSSAFNANNYRNYAKEDDRIPIIVNFEDPYNNGTMNGYSDEELAKYYEFFQDTGRSLYDSFADRNFGSFSDTIVYKNNRIYNKSSYSGFEKFAVTREQYYVMADFIDYAIKNNVKYYIKNINDVDIDWKYVSDTVFDKESNSLTIRYKDASKLNNGKSYKVVYTPSNEGISSPISDALKTISALLAFDEYADSTFNVLKRLEDSINIVEWETDKALIKLSDGYKRNPTNIDMLILYEQARYKYNNTLNATISELEKGVELPVKKITKRVFNDITNDYAVTGTAYYVTINSNNYEVELNTKLKDKAGNLILDSYSDPYYTLIDSDFGISVVNGYSGHYTYRHNGSLFSVNDNDVVSIRSVGAAINGNYTFNLDSFKDILVFVETGTKEIVGEDGSIIYTVYDDQIESVIKQDAWPNKLIRDLQIIYKDININNLIANGNWLEQLSEYVGGSQYGDYSSNIQTGLIHPLGLIMSEFFLGNVSASEKVLTFGDLEYSTKFDSDTIKALILSLLGEDRYFQTNAQINYFVEIFNAFMAPVLDEISYFENFELLSGNAQSPQLYTYKAYLASVLLSSSATGWFYDTANAMLGSVGIKEAMISGDGYILAYDDLSSYYREIIKRIYDQANKRLKDQFVDPDDDAYPEYMKALGAYIGADEMKDYFDGRLSWILKSVLSDSKKGEIVDSKKKEIKSAYGELIGEINAFKAFLSPEERELFEQNINRFFMDPYSNFSYKDNDFTLENGKKEKDDFDNITNAFQISNTREDIAKYNGSGSDEGSFSSYILQFVEKAGKDATDSIISTADDYYNSVSAYLTAKEDYYNVDNSASNMGKNEELKEQAERYFEQAKALYSSVSSWLRDYGGGDGDLIKYNSSSSSFNKESNWNKLLNKFNVLNDNYNSEKSSITDEELAQKVGTYIESIGGYIRTMKTLDQLNRYEILFAIESEMTESASISLDIVVNSKHYTVGQNFTKAKFIEYVLGYDVCLNAGYTPVFVEEGYKGIVRLEKANLDELKTYLKSVSDVEVEGIKYESQFTDDQKSLLSEKFIKNKDGYYKLSNSFADVHDFAVQLGNISATLYQMTNLSNLSSASIDEIVIDEDSQTRAVEKNLGNIILTMILEGKYLPEDLVVAFFNLEGASHGDSVYISALAKIGSDTKNTGKYLNTVLSYILMTENDENKKDYINYSTLTLKELRIRCLKALIDFEKQSGETTEQNQKRYLALLALGCSDWVDENNVGAIACNWSKERTNQIDILKVSAQSQAVILRLAGLENRPYEELIDAEYTIDFNIMGEDEKNGDLFIICIYDEETRNYVPFMMSNRVNHGGYDDNEEQDTFENRFNYKKAITDYYVSDDENDQLVYYPVLARGIVTADGQPTAIRRVDGNIEYYRDDVVIRNASDIGLETYFMSADQIKVHHTGISNIVNGITKLFTGKSIVEHLVSSIPRFAAHTNYNFCFGIDTTVQTQSVGGAISISYNFGRGDNLDMYYFYDINKLNIVFLLIGSFCLISALMKALWGATGRVFDVTLDFLLGPLAISTIALKTDVEKNKKMQESSVGYDTWKGRIINDVLSVLSYAVGFNIFFILSPIVSSMELFESTQAFSGLPLFNMVSLEFVNEVARFLMVIGLAYMTTRAPTLFSKIIGVDDGFERGDSVKASVKNMKNQVVDTWTGKEIADDMKAVKTTVINTIPGYQVAKYAKEKVQNTTGKVAGKAAEYYLRENGVPKDQAKQLGTALTQAISVEKKDDKGKKGKGKGDVERDARKETPPPKNPDSSKQKKSTKPKKQKK